MMPCGKSEGSLTQSEITSLLNIIKDQNLSAEEISARLNMPLFMVRGQLRELVLLGYLEIKDDQYVVSHRGKG